MICDTIYIIRLSRNENIMEELRVDEFNSKNLEKCTKNKLYQDFKRNSQLCTEWKKEIYDVLIKYIQK
jgi:hypothetical protein